MGERRRIARRGPGPRLGCGLPVGGGRIARRPSHRSMARLSRAAEHEPHRERRRDESRRLHACRPCIRCAPQAV